MRLALKHADRQSNNKTGLRIGSTLNALATWIDERTGFLAPLKSFFNYPVPKYVHKNLLYSLGGLTLIAILLQVITGLLLSFYYDPSPTEAYNSVDYVTYQLALGWLIRGLHYFNASAIVILITTHLLRTFSFSAYKKPRELTWLSGIFLLLVVLGFAFTGYLLPWDQRGYWATKVGTEIAASAPVIGEWQARLVRGGPELGQATLNRFYITHILLLPGALVLLILFHIYQLRYHGVAPPLTKRGQALANKFVPFFPHWVVIDATLGLILLAFLAFLSWRWPAPLEFPADPSSTDFVPRPEWYFLFLFQLLKYFPGPWEPVAAFLIPLVVIGSMILLPFIDRGTERRPWRKPLTTSIAGLYLVMILALTFLALSTDQQPPPADGFAAAQPQPEAQVVNPEPEIAAGEDDAAAEPEVSAAVAPAENLEVEPEAEAEHEPSLQNTTAQPDDSGAALAMLEVLPPAIPAASPAAQAPVGSKPNTLIAIAVSEATLDSFADFWAQAPRLEVATQGAKAALSGSDQKTGPLVTVQAAYDAVSLVVRLEWPDATASLLKNAWIWSGTRFTKSGNEDQFAMLWPIGNNAEFATKGCAAICHQADDDDKWWMGSESDSVRYDVWQWLAARTNPVRQADDSWWSVQTDPTTPASSRHSDALAGGGYQLNIAEDKRGPAVMHGVNPATPFIFAGEEIAVDPTALQPNQIVPGYILAASVGSRGDISARGVWFEGKWIVVLRRALSTGHEDDAVLTPGKRSPFGLAVWDSKNGINHNITPEVLILEWD
ncbi:MAG: Cytochrome b6 [Anaerolineae bacterium]|nr:Cytochrome b6 [Anaerolineae bacterium]